MGFQKHTSMHMIGVFLLLPVLIDIATGQMRILKNISDIRLVNGIGLYDGRVELLVNGTWGTICSTSFTRREAWSICKILFGERASSYETYRTTSNDYGAGSGPIYIDNLDCKGTETNINECTYSLDVSCTDHKRDVAVACRVRPLNITNTRLVNGTGPYDGRIELYADGHWGTIDRRGVDMYGAQTICNTHGASLAMYFDTAIYGEGTGPVLIGNIICYKEKDTINSCDLYAPYRRWNSHLYDLSIVCTPCGLPDIYNGDPVAFNGTELTVSCHTGFHPSQVKMKCLTDNSWSENQRCTPNHVFPLNITDIRLKHNYRHPPSEGRVEIMVNGTWGTICDTDFDVQDASVICKMFGLQYRRHYIKAQFAGRGSGPIYIDNLDCDGTESHINLCSYEISNNCTHYDDVAVKCTGYQLNITNIRLSGTSGPYHGRVELEVNGTWGTICDDRFDSNDARVICNMFGLRYRSHFNNAYYGKGNGPIYIDRLKCSNYDSHINDCKYAVNNYYNCGHDEDASVMCYGPTLNITAARLVNGTGPYDGRAEIKVNDTWGTICDENFNMLAADLFCDLLGLRAAQYYTGARNGEGSGSVFIDQLFCEEDDYFLSSCNYLFLNECSHGRDISVVCKEYQLEITDIRLAGTNGPYHGRVELKVNGTWGTVCGDRFSSAESSAVCNMLGLRYKRHFYHANYGQGTGPIYFYRLNCRHNYIHMKNYCADVVDNFYECGHDDDVAVMCYGPKLNITDARLVNGTGPYDGRAEIKVNDIWGTICDDDFNIQAAELFCNLLGLSATRYFTGARYGQGHGPVFIDQLFCEEDDYSLTSCKYLFLNECSHGRDISVVCNGFPLDITGVRLTDGPSPTNGRVELKSLDKWGTVCDDLFGMQEANAICSMLGYLPAVTYYSGAFYGRGTGPIFVDDLSCEADATHINNCTYLTYGNCNHGEDVSVVCTDCGDPTPENGFVNSTQSHYGATVHVTCDKDYNLIGDNNSICQIDGTWSNNPNCKLIDCGDPKPANGNINTTSTVHTTVATVWCNDGYTLIGDSVITCQSNEKWTNDPACDIIDCSFPEPKFADVALLDNKTTFGETAVIRCWTGYIPVMYTPVSCLANGTWEEWPECEIVAKPGDMSDSGNTADTSNVGLLIGVGVGTLAVTLLVVGIVIIIRRHLQHGELRRHTPENAHELTDVQQGNIRTMQESPNTPPTAGSSYVNTPPSVYEDLKDSNKDADIYDRIGGANVS